MVRYTRVEPGLTHSSSHIATWARALDDDRGPEPTRRTTTVPDRHGGRAAIPRRPATASEEYAAIDQYLPRRIQDGALDARVVHPRVASQPALTQYLDADLALSDRYVI